MEAVNIASVLPRMAVQQPHALAVIYPDGRDANGKVRYTHYTYRQLDEHSDRIARGLNAAGIGRGVRTVLMVRPSLEFFALTFGIFKVGAVPVLVDPGIGLRHLKSCLARAEPEAFIGIPAAHVARIVLRWGAATLRRTVTVGRRGLWGGVTLRQLMTLGKSSKEGALAPTLADETAAIVFTSGSTGPPKGVVYTHGNFVAQVEAIRVMFGIEPGEIDLSTFPLFALFDPALGMTTVVPDMDPTRPARVDPRRIIEAIEDFGVTHMFGSPALLNTVSRFGESNGVRLPSLRRVVSAGAPVSPEVIERLRTMLTPGADVYTPYGATEALPVTYISGSVILNETRLRSDAGHGVCVGNPVKGVDLAVIPISEEGIDRWDDSLRLPPGEIGEIVVKGKQVTAAYYNAPGKTALAKIADADGSVRHRMGDLGYLDGEGRLWFCGRKSHRVETASGVMYTVPCESVFNCHPRVFRSALVGVRRAAGVEPVLCVELERAREPVDRSRLLAELAEIARSHEHTRTIQTFLVHPGFPVDIRHNAKIGRERLAAWAAQRLR